MLYKTFEFEMVRVQSIGQTFTQHTCQRKVNFFTENINDNVTLDMIAIPGGTFDLVAIPGATFQMSFNAREDSEKETQQKVAVKPFYLGQYCITQEQWQTVMGNNPSELTKEKPFVYSFVDNISWNDAIEFCQKLSEITGKNYRLPSEAEWEYAYHSETANSFRFRNTVTPDLAHRVVNIFRYTVSLFQYLVILFRRKVLKKAESEKTTVDRSLNPNYFGLYDMYSIPLPDQWCSDNWYSKYEGAALDGSSMKPILDDTQGLRGGSWNCTMVRCRGPYRACLAPDHARNFLGFRVALDIISGEDF